MLPKQLAATVLNFLIVSRTVLLRRKENAGGGPHARWSCQWIRQSPAARLKSESETDGDNYWSKPRTHFHWLTAQYRNIYSGCVPFRRGPDQLLAALWRKLNYAVCLNLSRNLSSVTHPPPQPFQKTQKIIHGFWIHPDSVIRRHEMKQTHTRDRFCTFYLQNVLKFSVQRPH